MNRIESIKAKSKFVPEEHLVLIVDGVPLDELLDAALPEFDLVGQVSSLLGWFHNDEDSVVPWQRILPEIGCAGYAPILICPDDLDYHCGVVIVEVVAETNVIRWDRLGFNAARNGSSVGSCVRWLPGLGPYRFRREDYERCLEAFRAYALGNK